MTSDAPEDSGAPQRSVEIEISFDVDDDTALPDWSGVPGVVSVDPADVRELDGRYFDTAALDLARGGMALRRRTGGPDEGWHVKGPLVEGARVELHWPLGEREIPGEVRAALGEWAQHPLGLIARIRNTRRAYALRDAAGRVLAEFADDRVTATDERSGRVRAWREWELELGPDAPADLAWRSAFFSAATAAIHAAGGRPAASASKLARTLGH